MKIKRVVDGVELEFELTKDEIRKAYKVEDQENFISDALMVMKLDDDSSEAAERYFGVYLEKMMSSYHDSLHTDWMLVMEGVIKHVLDQDIQQIADGISVMREENNSN